MISSKLQRVVRVTAAIFMLGFAAGFFSPPSIIRAGDSAGTSCQAPPRDEKGVIAKVIKDSICWALTKDRALAESTLAHDEDLFYFWTSSTFTVRGWNQHLKYFDMWMDPRFKAVRTDVRDLEIHLSRSGDVAWYSAILDDVVEWDGKTGGGENLRWTGVLEKRDGAWVIVQMHASFAVDQVRGIAPKHSQE